MVRKTTHPGGTGRGDRLEGQLLIAMPTMRDPRFQRSVIFMCSHDDSGAMGLIVNQRSEQLSFADLLVQLKLVDAEGKDDLDDRVQATSIHVGGPVEKGRGFVLHTPDYETPTSTVKVGRGVCLTATVDILRAIAAGRGPRRALLALGYAGWGPGQLESEIQANGWLNCPGDPEVVFEAEPEHKYDLALSLIGIDPSFLVGDAGHA